MALATERLSMASRATWSSLTQSGRPTAGRSITVPTTATGCRHLGCGCGRWDASIARPLRRSVTTFASPRVRHRWPAVLLHDCPRRERYLGARTAQEVMGHVLGPSVLI